MLLIRLCLVLMQFLSITLINYFNCKLLPMTLMEMCLVFSQLKNSHSSSLPSPVIFGLLQLPLISMSSPKTLNL